MQWQHIALVILVSYFIGGLNGSLLVSKLFLKADIREYGSGNAGTTNALRVMGKKWAAVVTVLDLLKGALAVIFGNYMLVGFGEANLGKLLAGVFAIVGHIFPVYFRFKGGKGVMTALAIVAFVDWRVAAICLSLFIVVVAATRWVSLGSILAVCGVPVCMYLFHRGSGRETVILTALSAVITVLLVVMHRENIKRILSGTERRFSFKGRAMLSTVKTKTVSLGHKTGGAIRKTSRRIKAGASGIRTRRKRRRGSKVSRRKLRKARKATQRRKNSKRSQNHKKTGRTQDPPRRAAL